MYNNGSSHPGFSPAPGLSPPPRWESDIIVASQYLEELLSEYQKLSPFMPMLPECRRLLSREIMRVSGMASAAGLGDLEMLMYRSPSPNAIPSPKIRVNHNSWKELHQERLGFVPMTTNDWQGAQQNPNDYVVKKIVRLDVPSEKYPNFNFVGRILGPRGNSLKRVEASTGCRVFIRGKGSIKDSEKEEKLKGKPGFEHLSDPLHILIEAELPANVIDMKLHETQQILEELLKPMDESQDTYKKQQLRELAAINSSLREGSPHHPSISPHHTNNNTKPAKTTGP